MKYAKIAKTMKKQLNGTMIWLIVHIGIFNVKQMKDHYVLVQQAQLSHPRGRLSRAAKDVVKLEADTHA